MRYHISFEQGCTIVEYLVKAEIDDIFIAMPKTKGEHSEKIFLTKTKGQWVGDCDDKKLVEKIGQEIDAVHKPKITQEK